MSLHYLENLLKRRSQSASCEFQLPDYYLLEAICASRTSEVSQPRCGHPWYNTFITVE